MMPRYRAENPLSPPFHNASSRVFSLSLPPSPEIYLFDVASSLSCVFASRSFRFSSLTSLLMSSTSLSCSPLFLPPLHLPEPPIPNQSVPTIRFRKQPPLFQIAEDMEHKRRKALSLYAKNRKNCSGNQNDHACVDLRLHPPIHGQKRLK